MENGILYNANNFSMILGISNLVQFHLSEPEWYYKVN